MSPRTLVALLPLGLVCCFLPVAIAYVYADAVPLVDAELDLARPVAERFPEFEQTAHGALERVAGEIAPDRAKNRPWRLRVSMEVHRNAEQAELERSQACAWRSRGIEAAAIRTQVGRFGRACISPLIEQRNDPEGGSLPRGVYAFFVEATNGRLLVSIWGTSREVRPIDEVLAELGRRLR